MRVLVATDAWRPPGQRRGAGRSIHWRARGKLGVTIEFLSPEGFPSSRCRPIPACGWRCRAAADRGAHRGGAARRIHIATEGPIGFARALLLRRHACHSPRVYTTRFPEYISAPLADPASVIYAMLRWFPRGGDGDDGGDAPSLTAELFRARLLPISAVDARRGYRSCSARIAPSISACRGRLHDRRPGRRREESRSVSLLRSARHPRSSSGPARREAELKREYSSTQNFSACWDNGILASHLAGADVFVFPSLTDTSAVVRSKRSPAVFSRRFSGHLRRTSRRTIRSASCMRFGGRFAWAPWRCRATPAAAFALN